MSKYLAYPFLYDKPDDLRCDYEIFTDCLLYTSDAADDSLLEHLSKWAKDNNKIVIGVLHDLNLVHYFSDAVCLLNHGEIVCYGSSREVFNGDYLKEVYNIDIKEFMLEVLEKWK